MVLENLFFPCIFIFIKNKKLFASYIFIIIIAIPIASAMFVKPLKYNMFYSSHLSVGFGFFLVIQLVEKLI